MPNSTGRPKATVPPPRKFKISSLSGIPDRFAYRSASALVFVAFFGSIGLYILQTSHAATNMVPEMVSAVASHWCLNDAGGPGLVNTAVCNGSDNQQWQPSSGVIRNTTQAKAVCLQPGSGIARAGTLIVAVRCNGSSAQQWMEYEGGYESELAAHTVQKVCLDALNTRLSVEPCDNTTSEHWQEQTFTLE